MQIRRLTSLNHSQMRELGELLMDAVEGGASVGFLSLTAMNSIAEYWQSIASAMDSNLALFVAEQEGRIVGSVQIALCPKENGRHRAEIQKLFVLQNNRGKGLASRLMQAAEEFALSRDRTLLVLDTEQGSTAESMYEHWGWNRAGAIPGYAASPDGVLHPTVFFYKRLDPER